MSYILVDTALDVRQLTFDGKPRRLTLVEQLTLIHLTRHAREDGFKFDVLTVPELADTIGVGDRSIQRARLALETCDEHYLSPTMGKYGGRGKGTEYQVTFPDWLIAIHDRKHRRHKRQPGKVIYLPGAAPAPQDELPDFLEDLEAQA